jgi:hypothetical protein
MTVKQRAVYALRRCKKRAWLETLKTGTLDMLADAMVKYQLPREAWIETIVKRYGFNEFSAEILSIYGLPAPEAVVHPHPAIEAAAQAG